MAVDFTKNEFSIRREILDIFWKHHELLCAKEYPYEDYKDDPVFSIGAFRVHRHLLTDIMGDFENDDPRREVELAAEPGQGNDQPKGTGAD